jgi:hypothetical protein
LLGRTWLALEGFLQWSNGTACSVAESHNWSAMLVEQARIGIAHVNGQIRALAAGTLLLLALSLGGCTTSTAAASLVDARAEASATGKTSGYPSLEVLRPSSEVMKADKRLKLEKELSGTIDRGAGAAATAEVS